MHTWPNLHRQLEFLSSYFALDQGLKNHSNYSVKGCNGNLQEFQGTNLHLQYRSLACTTRGSSTQWINLDPFRANLSRRVSRKLLTAIKFRFKCKDKLTWQILHKRLKAKRLSGMWRFLKGGKQRFLPSKESLEFCSTKIVSPAALFPPSQYTFCKQIGGAQVTFLCSIGCGYASLPLWEP